MSSSFAVHGARERLSLRRGRGTLRFRVDNTSQRTVRSSLYVDVDLREGVKPYWFQILDDTHRTLRPGEQTLVQVRVEVPSHQSDLKPRLNLGVANVEAPQEDFQSSPTTLLEGISWVPDPERPWWRQTRWIVCFLVLTVVVLGGFVTLLVI